jgi:drug/metabolite transporter (DMT)-like permease
LPLSAVLMIVGSTLCFAVLDSTIKLLAQRYPVLLLVWARWGMQVLALLVWLAPQIGAGLVRTRHFGMQLTRGALLMGSSVCFMSALKYLPLADATAINYSTPIIVSVMAVMFLDERMTNVRIAFVVAGIVGMLLIVRPASDVFQGASLLALCAAGFYGTFQIMTRKLAHEDWRISLFYPALVSTTVMSFVVPFLDWPDALSWMDAVLLVFASLFGTFGHYLFLRAFQRASASALTPFTYTQIIWATMIGWIVFRTFPDGWTLTGMAVIATSGLLITVHEHRQARARPSAQPAAREPAAVD